MSASRLLSAFLALLIVVVPVADGTAAASLDDVRAAGLVPPNPFSVRDKSGYEQVFNPFGDEWATKGPPNTAIPISLTPACYKLSPKNRVGMAQEELELLAKSNSPLIWENCADLADASGPNPVGAPRIKENVAKLKALNPSIKYIGGLPIVRADTSTAGSVEAPVGITYINANREDWFVHIKGAAPTRENRVAYIFTENNPQPSHLFDITKPDFRRFMVDRILESLNFHGLDGFVMAECLDLPSGNTRMPVPDEIVAGWNNGCMSMLEELRVAFEQSGKLVFFTGFAHLGSIGRPDNEIREEEAFQERIIRSHGFFWEDAFRAVTAPDEVAQSSFERYKRMRAFAVTRGRYMVNIVNTFIEGRTTSAAEERRQARYHLAAYLAGLPEDPGQAQHTVMLHYTPAPPRAPGENRNQFATTAFFKEWDLRIGNPVGPDVRKALAVYQREFQGARVVYNGSSQPFTVDLSGGPFTDEDGRLQGGSAVVPPKSGAIFPRLVEQVACAPRPPVRVQVTSLGGGTIRADITAGSTAGSLRSVRVVDVRNASVDVQNGPSGQTGPFMHSVGFGTTATSLTVRKSGGSASMVRLIVTDGCGEWPTFVGAGSGVR